MKKLLILAYDFPPYVSVGGLRPYNWFKYLNEFGIEPVVVTRQWGNEHGNHLDYISAGWSVEVVIETIENGTILRSPYKPNLSNHLLLKYGEGKFRLLRKAISGFYEMAQYMYPTGPISAVYRAAREYLKHHKVDAIIATGDPFVLFSYASKLSMEFGIPWIADYRDPWSQSFSSKKNFIQRKIDRLLELKHVKSANLITTVDELFKLKISELFPNKQIELLPNGFDPGIQSEIADCIQHKNVLSFAFVGTVNNWHPIEHLLSSFNTFSRNNAHIPFQLNFYGINAEELITNWVQTNCPYLHDKVSIKSRLPNQELAKEMSTNNVLLLFNYYEFTGTKIYDYLAVKRKILLCFGNDPEALQLKKQFYFKTIETTIQPQVDILKTTNSGIVVKNAAHLQEVLGELWDEFSTTGQVACDSVGVEKYSRKVQVEKLAELIRGI